MSATRWRVGKVIWARCSFFMVTSRHSWKQFCAPPLLQLTVRDSAGWFLSGSCIRGMTRHESDVIIAFSWQSMGTFTRPRGFQTPNLNLQKLSISLRALSIYLVQALAMDLSHAVIRPRGLVISYISVRRFSLLTSCKESGDSRWWHERWKQGD